VEADLIKNQDARIAQLNGTDAPSAVTTVALAKNAIRLTLMREALMNPA